MSWVPDYLFVCFQIFVVDFSEISAVKSLMQFNKLSMQFVGRFCVARTAVHSLFFLMQIHAEGFADHFSKKTFSEFSG